MLVAPYILNLYGYEATQAEKKQAPPQKKKKGGWNLLTFKLNLTQAESDGKWMMFPNTWKASTCTV